MLEKINYKYSEMIKNIIFDFGDVFINLDKSVLRVHVPQENLNFDTLFDAVNEAFEIGAICSDEFLDTLRAYFPEKTKKKLNNIWNSMLLDLPDYRLEFLEELAALRSHRLFLLSNTNALHIPHVKEKIGSGKFDRFQGCFEKFYLSHELRLRKPDPGIFRLVLTENGLNAEETLFIDDTEGHTKAAASLGIHTWHLQVGKEDVVQLMEKL